MQQLIEAIVKPLVDYPEDRGKVIGKQGRVAKAIRTIVYSAAGGHQKKKTYVDILD